jgi:hypothetical protein
MFGTQKKVVCYFLNPLTSILHINFTYVLSLFMCIQRLTLPEVSPIISFSTSSTETLL